jgi:hypothetical protein
VLLVLVAAMLPRGVAFAVDGVAPPAQPVVVTVPKGFYVRTGTLGAVSPSEPGLPLYGRPGHMDVARDPLLSTGFLLDDEDQLVGRRRTVPALGAGGTDGRLIRNGRWAWAIFDVGGMDAFVAARGLSDAAVLAAARATTTDADYRVGPRIGASGLPRGFEQLVVARVGPYGALSAGELVQLWSEDGRREVVVSVFRADAPALALARFWAAQRGRRDSPSAEHPTGYHAALRVRGDLVTFVYGPLSQSRIDGVARSARAVDDAEWQAFLTV